MAVHYTREMLAESTKTGLQPATIAIGKSQEWQGLVDLTGQVAILEMMGVARDMESARRKAEVDRLRAGQTLTIPGMEDSTLPPAPTVPVPATMPEATAPHAAGRKRGRRKKGQRAS